MRIFWPGDQVWLCNFRRSEKWTKGTITTKVGTAMYKVKCCSEICEKYIDQLLFYPDIETKSEVIDTSQPEQNLSLHPIFHSIKADQSNQTIIFPPLDNNLSNNPNHYIITSICWHPSSNWTKHRHICTAIRHKSVYREGQNKRNCRAPTYLKDHNLKKKCSAL